MTPAFSKAVDPVFEYVLALLDRIDNGDEPDPHQTQVFLHTVLLNRAEQELRASNDWRLAKRALVCWIDELLIRAAWKGREWWINNPLEFLLFQTGDRAILFYTHAKESVAAAQLDALEVYYLCVILGFRGIYERTEEHGLDIAAHDLAPTLEEWLRRTSEGIRLSPVVPITSAGRIPQGAPPLGGQAFMTSALVLLVVAAAVFSVALWYRFKGTPKAARTAVAASAHASEPRFDGGRAR
jgi:type VI secretion system protein ImpK